MKKQFVFLIFWLSSPGFAAVLLKKEVECAGRKFAPSVTIEEGMWADITQDEILLRITAKGNGDETVKIRTELARLQGTQIEILGTPSITTKWNSAAEVEMKDDDGNLTYRLRIIPSIQVPAAN